MRLPRRCVATEIALDPSSVRKVNILGSGIISAQWFSTPHFCHQAVTRPSPTYCRSNDPSRLQGLSPLLRSQFRVKGSVIAVVKRRYRRLTGQTGFRRARRPARDPARPLLGVEFIEDGVRLRPFISTYILRPAPLSGSVTWTVRGNRSGGHCAADCPLSAACARRKKRIAGARFGTTRPRYKNPEKAIRPDYRPVCSTNNSVVFVPPRRISLIDTLSPVPV